MSEAALTAIRPEPQVEPRTLAAVSIDTPDRFWPSQFLALAIIGWTLSGLISPLLRRLLSRTTLGGRGRSIGLSSPLPLPTGHQGR